MARKSAGILMYRWAADVLLVMLVHPGGPFWIRRDLSSWSIPKGEYGDDEEAEAAARREFAEETGQQPNGILLPLGALRQRTGKLITAFALEGDLDVEKLQSNIFEMEWPPRSGHIQSFPEIDRAAWFQMADAHKKIVAGQRPFLSRLERLLAARA
ncbi:NUDIX domain-containing protein [Mesorhizobium sp. YR577]|uniref:NUDIX domain-containing protein n=1 Tax=Mesorhizobium sp. YR577 TaxID=1884373 RepID=UPI0008E14E25|nr:NUDIX domain-containing protein [Mesorhizobium sp. YR577]SFU23334.1 Predicted NTP pyrophosphohydrolase, NUDIX family [Mesorhizobium sp. YR577]